MSSPKLTVALVLLVIALASSAFASVKLPFDLQQIQAVGEKQALLNRVTQSFLKCGLVSSDFQFANTEEAQKEVLGSYEDDYKMLVAELDSLIQLSGNDAQGKKLLEKTKLLGQKSNTLVHKMSISWTNRELSPMSRMSIIMVGMTKITAHVHVIQDNLDSFSTRLQEAAAEKRRAFAIFPVLLVVNVIACLGALIVLLFRGRSGSPDKK